MDNVWLVIAGAVVILVILGWVFSYIVRDLGWRGGMGVLGFNLFTTAAVVGGAFLIAFGIKGEL